MSYRIKKDDLVKVLSGKDKGATDKVLRVVPSSGKAIVENINFVIQHKRSGDPKKPGGRIKRESPIQLSKLMLICEKCKFPTRVGAKIKDDGTKFRVCKKCNAEI
jgi:large subunit ribosomal protein L24